MNRTLIGDCRLILTQLIAEGVRVNCVITSPPYFGLRDYGTAQWEGGSEECDHSSMRRNHTDEKQASSSGTSRDPIRANCRLCGARRIDAQIGLEPTLDAYMQTMVEVFRLVRELLADDGTLWLNMGDSYSGSWGAQSRGNGHNSPVSTDQIEAAPKITQTGSAWRTGLKPKEPLRRALARGFRPSGRRLVSEARPHLGEA
jgi:DNA modification methylase